MTIHDALSAATRQLTPVSTTPRLDAQVLLAYILKTDRSTLLSRLNEPLSSSEMSRFNQIILQRSTHIPVAYLTQTAHFYKDTFTVNENVLIPRPETENLVSYCLNQTPQGCTLLDLGTGSGCIAISLKKYRPDLNVAASDLSQSALKLAKANTKAHQVEIEFKRSDLLEQWDRPFDWIVANLPYVPRAYPHSKEVDHEPKGAVFAGTDGLALYRQFFPQLKSKLKSGGRVVIEALPEQHAALIALALSNNLAHIDRQDFRLVFSR